jgi:hypothetical protein
MPMKLLSREHATSACRLAYALFAHCPDLCHVAAYAGQGSPYLVVYVDGPCGAPWLPVMHLDGLPVYCQRAGGIEVRRVA